MKQEKQFSPDTLFNLTSLARNMTYGTDNPFEAHVWSRAGMILLEALDGEGLETEAFSDLEEFLDINYVSAESIILAQREAEILQARAKSGECLDCGKKHDSEDNHVATAIN